MLTRRRCSLWILLVCCCALLSGCLSTLLNQPAGDINEQLYIDARLGFAIKHPLDWLLVQIPVSSPKYRADTILWKIKDLKQQHLDVGEIMIISRTADPKKQLPDLLSSYLSSERELKSSKVENFDHPSGPALKLLGHDDNRGRLTIALKGQSRDFIISLDFPTSRFDELLPVFEDIVASFVEVVVSEPVGN